MLRRPDSAMSESDEPESKLIAKNPDTRITMAPKRHLSLGHMILLNAVVCGIEVCACAGFTYVTPILLKAGYSEEKMSFLLGIGPFLGIFLVPIIGRSSDRCRSVFGRRRPFIFVIGIGCMISLIIIPYSASVTYKLGNIMSYPKVMSLIFLAVGVVLLDFTTLVALNPCEALLSDMTVSTDQSDRIFMIYSIMVSVGGCIGYLITALDWTDSSVSTYMGGQEQSIFAILLIVFTVSLLATLITAKERPLRAITASTTSHESGYESSDDETTDLQKSRSTSHVKSRRTSTSKIRSTLNIIFFPFNITLKIAHLICHKSILSAFCKIKKRITRKFNKVTKQMKDFLNVPQALRYLALADFFSWTNIMCFTYFFSDFMGQTVYGGSPSGEIESESSLLYDQGVRMASLGLLLHCVVAAIYAPIVEKLMYIYGQRVTLIWSMAIGTAAMMVIAVVHTPVVAVTMAALTGFGNAALTIIPYTLMTQYHNDKQLYFYDSPEMSALSDEDDDDDEDDERGIAGDFAILDCSYFVAEVALALSMGYIVQYSGTTIAYIVTASFLGVVACLMLRNIITNKEEMSRHIQTQQQAHRVLESPLTV